MSLIPTRHAICLIPTEIWREILQYATEIQGWDEFGYDTCSHLLQLDCSRSYYIPYRKERQALRDRLHLVLVCKLWHQIAIQFLWSHLKLKASSWARIGDQLQDLLDRQPELCSFVIRLDISDSLYSDDLSEENTSIYQEMKAFLDSQLYPRLRRLRVLCAPQALATGNHPTHPTIVYIHSGEACHSIGGTSEWIEDDTWDAGSHFWRHAKILDLNVEFSAFSSEIDTTETIMFPELTSLTVRAGIDRHLVHHVATHWRAPSLTVLILQFNDTDAWIYLLRWSSTTLVSLNLSTNHLNRDAPIDLPNLKTLLLQGCFTKEWTEVIAAPALTTITFKDPNVDLIYTRNRGAFALLVDRVVNRYSQCKSVAYYYQKKARLLD
jgi:hypothetical protein